MTAADGIAMLERRALASRRFRIAAAIALGTFVLLGLAYCSGRSAGAAAARGAMVDSVRKVLSDSSKQIEARLAARAPTVVASTRRADSVRVIYRQAAGRVAIVSDTVVRVDSVTFYVSTPIVQTIARCDSLVVADSIAIRVVAAQLDDMTKDRDTWRARAELDERNRPHLSRFGFRSGLVTGASLALLVIHFL